MLDGKVELQELKGLDGMVMVPQLSLDHLVLAYHWKPQAVNKLKTYFILKVTTQ